MGDAGWKYTTHLQSLLCSAQDFSNLFILEKYMELIEQNSFFFHENNKRMEPESVLFSHYD